MSKTVKANVKTKVGDLAYVFIKGQGRNQAMPGQPENFQFVASIITQKDSDVHKHFKEQVDAVWSDYAKANGVKGGPATNGIKPMMVKSDTEKDEYGEPVKVDSGKVIITFKSNTTWPDGKPNQIKVLDGKGKDLTAGFHSAPWSIGEGSRGIIHGTAMGNDAGGKHKVTLYLSAIQLAKLVKYEGTSVDAEEIDEAEDIDMDGIYSSVDAGDEPEV